MLIHCRPQGEQQAGLTHQAGTIIIAITHSVGEYRHVWNQGMQSQGSQISSDATAERNILDL